MAEYYFDREFATVRYEPADEVIVATFVLYRQGMLFRSYMNAIIEAVEDTGCSKLLVDAERHPNMHHADKVWVASNWVKEAQDAGIQRMATIPPDMITALMDLEDVYNRSRGFVDIPNGMFGNYDAAVRWLNAFE